RCRDVRPDAVDHEAQQGEEELFLELRDLEQIGNRRRHAIVPPACSIFCFALADTATPFTTNFRPETSPVPSSLIGWSGRRTSPAPNRDRKSTRLNSSHVSISYAVFC